MSFEFDCCSQVSLRRNRTVCDMTVKVISMCVHLMPMNPIWFTACDWDTNLDTWSSCRNTFHTCVLRSWRLCALRLQSFRFLKAEATFILETKFTVIKFVVIEETLNIIFHTICGTLYETWDQVNFHLKMETVCYFENYFPLTRVHDVTYRKIANMMSCNSPYGLELYKKEHRGRNIWTRLSQWKMSPYGYEELVNVDSF